MVQRPLDLSLPRGETACGGELEDAGFRILRYLPETASAAHKDSGND